MNFEKFGEQLFWASADAVPACGCACSGQDTPYSVGLESVKEGSKNIGSCIS